VNGAVSPPPGGGLETTIGKSPAVASALAAIVAWSSVSLVYVVVSEVPLKRIVLPATKPEPVTMIGVSFAPAAELAGVTFWIDALGFATVNAIVVESPPPGPGLTILTGKLPDVARRLDGIDASSEVAPSYVVTRSVAPKTTFEPVTKPVQ